jgi:hypothetical protein
MMDDGKASECEAPSREATPAWPVEGLLKPVDDGKASECEAPSREATPAWPVEGLLKPVDDGKASECEAPSREATPNRATSYRGCRTPREQALVEGLLKPMDDVSMSAFAFQSSIVHHQSTMSFEGV